MFKVVTKRFLNEAKTICLFEIEAPLVARHAQAGQFVIFRLDEQGERTPVSVAGYDREKGTVTVMVQAAGRTTKMLHTVEEGDYISDFVGPLGKATEMDGLKKVCVVGGGVGCAIAYPIAKEMHEKGIDVTFIAGFRSKDIVILEDEMKAASNKSIICTDDGSYGIKGFTTALLQQEIDAQKTYQQTAIREEGRVDVGEAGTQTFLFDEAVAADLMHVLEHVDCRACSNQEILTIILDEADAFFQGRKTAQEASRIMDSRAALFIAENS